MNRRAVARREQTAAGIRGSFFSQYGVALPRSTNDVPDFVQAIRARIEAGPEFGYLAGTTGTSSSSGRSGTSVIRGGGGTGEEEEGEDHLHAAAAPGVRAATPETAARPASRSLDHVGEHLQGGGSSSASTSSQAMSMAASLPAHGAPAAPPVFRGTATTGEEDLTATTSAGAGPREEGGEMQLEFVSPRESPTGGAAGDNPPGAGSGADNAVTSTLLGPTAGANADQAQEFLAHLVSSGLQSQEVAELLAEEARLAAAHAWAASSSASSASSVAPSVAVSPEGDAAVALPSPSNEGSPVTIHANGRLRETLVELQGRLSRFPHHVARIQQSITELEHDAAGGVDQQQPQQRDVGDTETTTFSIAASAQVVVDDGSPTIAWDRRRRRESQLVTNRPATTGGTSTGSGAYTLPIVPAVAPLSAPAATVEPDLIARPVSAPGSLEVGHDLCIVCQTNPRNASFVHGTTAHIACCYQCALETRRRNRNCPICRQRIDLVVQNFQS